MSVPALPVPADLGRLVMQCPDRPGIVAAVSSLLAEHGANIVESDQATTDPEGGHFFLRMVFHRAGLADHLDAMTRDFAATIGERFAPVRWSLADVARRTPVAIMVSRYDHCLVELLWRARRGELPVEVVQVISNHPDLADEVAAFGVPFAHVPVTSATKADAEQQTLALLDGRVELVVLARYMQILSADFLDAVGCPVINIHHSFLPAFAGARPYDQAKRRGVKLIGATAHYATRDLDEGPIIEQDVVRVSHRDDVAALVRRGADVERSVLGRAVLWHCEGRVLRHGEQTVVFSP